MVHALGETGSATTLEINATNDFNSGLGSTLLNEATNAPAVIEFNSNKKSGTGTTAWGADVNLLSIGSVGSAQVIFKGDGEIWSNETATVGVYDSYDDALLVRALDHVRNPIGLVKEKWDDFIKYNKQDLIDARLLGHTGEMVSVTGMQRLHNGAIWQGYVRHQELAEEVRELKSRLLALEGA